MVASVPVVASAAPEPGVAEWGGADDGVHAWSYRRRAGTGYDWVHYELSLAPTSGGVFLSHLPRWGRPSTVGAETRICLDGVLAIGWPFPWVAKRWTDVGGTGRFPPPIDQETPLNPDTAEEMSGDRPGWEQALQRVRSSPFEGEHRVIWSGAAKSFGCWWAVMLVLTGMVAQMRAKKAPAEAGA